MEIKAHYGKSGNVKLGNMWTWSTLYSDQDFIIPEMNNRVVKGTCSGVCDGCRKECYVKKSYVRHTNHVTGECSVKYGHAVNTVAMREDIKKATRDLIEQVRRARKKPDYIRVNQSGEVENREQEEMHVAVSREYPNITSYQYTKQYDVVIPMLLNGEIPENHVVLISVWHEYGIAEYKRVSHLPNVKAFAVVDDEWTIEKYAAHGLDIQTMCYAYGKNGKLNHDITCDKCQKCMAKRDNMKVIGCYMH